MHHSFSLSSLTALKNVQTILGSGVVQKQTSSQGDHSLLAPDGEAWVNVCTKLGRIRRSQEGVLAKDQIIREKAGIRKKSSTVTEMTGKPAIYFYVPS